MSKNNRKKHRKPTRSKGLLNAIANRNRALRKVLEIQEKLDRGLAFRVNGLDVSEWWLSTPQARKRSNYRRIDNAEIQ